MALNIKDPETERLAAEVASLSGESKTRAVRVALHERKQRLVLRVKRLSRRDTMRRFLERDVWPLLPPEEKGRVLTAEEEDAILGYGPAGA